MARLQPFRGIRPRSDRAGDIIAPPYDVVDRAEARAILARQPDSFLQVTRPDATLPDSVDEHAPEIYAQGRGALDAMLADGRVVQDDRPCFYLYSQTWRGHTQTGLMALCSVAEYDEGRIKRHELTRPDKEQDRVDHIEALDCQTGLVFLAYRDDDDAVKAAMVDAAAQPPAWSATTDDGVTHSLRVVAEPLLVERIQSAFAHLPALYVADGHHRSAAASRKGAGTSAWFLAGIFPDGELQVLAYNRLVLDLNGRDAATFLAEVEARFTVTDTDRPDPAEPGTFTLYLGGKWRLLRPHPDRVPADDPVGRLDVAVLQDQILRPLLGIENPRTDPRIRFVGGIRGAAPLVAAVDAGQAAVAFHLYPTSMAELFDVADADRLMPPKSTWFEPKLRGGVVAHRIV